MKKAEQDAQLEAVKIKPINMRVLALTIVGTSQYVQNRFGQKAIMEKYAALSELERVRKAAAKLYEKHATAA